MQDSAEIGLYSVQPTLARRPSSCEQLTNQHWHAGQFNQSTRANHIGAQQQLHTRLVWNIAVYKNSLANSGYRRDPLSDWLIDVTWAMGAMFIPGRSRRRKCCWIMLDRSVSYTEWLKRLHCGVCGNMPCCAAVNCANRTEKGFRLYRFPADPIRRAVWAARVKRDNWAPTDYSYLCQVCHLHFSAVLRFYMLLPTEQWAGM